MTIGKAIGSGVPAGALGLKADAAERMLSQEAADYEDTGGIGGTLAGNPLSLAAVRATLEHVLTEEAFALTIPLAGRFSAGVEEVAGRHRVPWNVTQLGCRAEYRFESEPARNGTQAHAAADPELERYLHLHALNRGVLLTPFHNMALIVAADQRGRRRPPQRGLRRSGGLARRLSPRRRSLEPGAPAHPAPASRRARSARSPAAPGDDPRRPSRSPRSSRRRPCRR